MVRDLTEVRERYALERGRRVRADGMAQYRYVEVPDDPAQARVEREPVHDEVDVVVIGGGISGLCAAVELRKRGIERIRIIDRAGDVGGTWYWNRYPGAQCDIESYTYMPLLEELGVVPSERYAHQPEILEHLKRIAQHWNLYELAYFHTDVTEMRWDEALRRWHVHTDRLDEMRAQFVVVAGGFLQRPKLPDIPGIEDFQGELFHTSRWNYEYTGGGPGVDGGGLPGLVDKKVGVVGTGATGLQVVPPVAEAAEHLYVFQRTPSVVLPRDNRETDPEWAASLQPGWQKERMDNFTALSSGGQVDKDLIDDGWTHFYVPMLTVHAKSWRSADPQDLAAAELADLEVMESARGRVSAEVHDADVAESLKPYFRFMCKRPGFHDEYLGTFNRPNVTLVDTHGHGVEKVLAHGVIADGQEYELDCLILATGFDTGRGLLKSTGLRILGRDRIDLADHWAKGMRSFQGCHTAGFPNVFFLGLTQAGNTVSFTHGLMEQGRHIAWLIGETRSRGADTIETTVEAETDWVDTIISAQLPGRLEFLRACTPSYFNNEGQVDDPNRFSAGTYYGGPVAFFRMLEEWRADGTMQGLVLS